ncbi:MAG TPA: hypothetical protein PLB01_00050 [Thermoanaerobaculia bacterium]|nr:hypothetical protein [Thermoanaerobaculia bacterium]
MGVIPYSFTLWGAEWRVVWGWTGPQHWRGFRWNPKRLAGLCVFEPLKGNRIIILNPTLKSGSAIKRWEAFAHEVLHAITYEARFRRVSHWKGRDLSHSVIDRLEFPLAVFLMENARFGGENERAGS